MKTSQSQKQNEKLPLEFSEKEKKHLELSWKALPLPARPKIIKAPHSKLFWMNPISDTSKLLIEDYIDFFIERISFDYFVYGSSKENLGSFCLDCCAIRTKKELRKCSSNTHQILPKIYLNDITTFYDVIRKSEDLSKETHESIYIPAFFTKFYNEKKSFTNWDYLDLIILNKDDKEIVTDIFGSKVKDRKKTLIKNDEPKQTRKDVNSIHMKIFEKKK